MSEIPELLIPYRTALPQELYLSELALPFAVMEEARRKEDENDP